MQNHSYTRLSRAIVSQPCYGDVLGGNLKEENRFLLVPPNSAFDSSLGCKC